MSFDIATELKRTFDLASLRREAKHNLSGDDWHDYQTLKQSFAEKRQQEKRDFDRTYATTVEAERQRLIDKAGAKAKHFRHRWFGDDAFDKAALTRQAHRNVRHRFEQTLAALDDQERQSTEQLLERVSPSRKTQRSIKPGFLQAANRRRGIDRRRDRTRD
jgi:hypothetical protein